MSNSRLILAIFAVFILSVVFGTLIHAFLLHSDYATLSQIYRSPGDTKLVTIWVAYFAFAIGAVWMYAHGVEDKPWFGQGVRFGIAVWLVLSVPSFLIAYATQPLPESLTWKQLTFELINKIVLGIVTAAILRKP